MLQVRTEDKKIIYNVSCIKYAYIEQALLSCANKTLGELYHLKITIKPWIKKIEEQHKQKSTLASIEFLETYKEIENIIRETTPAHLSLFIRSFGKLNELKPSWSRIGLEAFEEYDIIETIDEKYKNDAKMIKKLLEYSVENNQKLISYINGDD